MGGQPAFALTDRPYLLYTWGMKMDKPKQFKTTLERWLEATKASKRQLATDAKISRSHLDKIISGDCVPTLEVADRIADACGIPLENMLAGGPKKHAIPA